MTFVLHLINLIAPEEGDSSRIMSGFVVRLADLLYPATSAKEPIISFASTVGIRPPFVTSLF